MKTRSLPIALTLLNLVILLHGLVQSGAASSDAEAPVLRGSAFELVDENGQVRSKLGIEENGEVVLRMVDQTGTIRMKLGAGMDGSGLVLLDDETEPGVHLLAKPEGPTVTLTGKDGKELVLTP